MWKKENKMKKSELRQLIREEIRNIFREVRIISGRLPEDVDNFLYAIVHILRDFSTFDIINFLKKSDKKQTQDLILMTRTLLKRRIPIKSMRNYGLYKQLVNLITG